MSLTANKSAPSELFQKAQALSSTIREHRRHIHAHPELSFKESETAKFVAERLKEMGLNPRTNVGATGVICDIGDPEKGRTVAIRADMDALPIEEISDEPYCSKNRGVMHACGHDAHTACGLGAARLLAESPPTNGCIRMVFQPAEEDTNEDGISGATLMIRDGAFTGVEKVVALHVIPEVEAGKVALRSGPLLAACDRFDIKIQGKGSHGAWPHLGIDSIVIASQVVQTVQTIISRRKSALEPAVITIGGIRSSTYRPNIVADSVELTGTVRYFHKETQSIIKTEIERACSIAELMGGSHELRYITENPAVENDPEVVALVDGVAREMLGEAAVVEADMEMGAEDFSFLSQEYPSCFIFLGSQLKDDFRMLHTASFDIDESCLPIGAAMLAACALRMLD